MTWEYGLIGLVVGIAIGVMITRFGSKKIRDQHAIQYELEKTKDELKEYKQELNTHFTHSAELLDNLAKNYRDLYQHMAKGTQELLPEQPTDHLFTQNLRQESHDEVPTQMPRDYSEGASGLLRSSRPSDK